LALPRRRGSSWSDTGIAVAAGGVAGFTPEKAHLAGLADVVAVAVFIGAALGDGDAVAGEAAVAFLELIPFIAGDQADHAGIVAGDAAAVFAPLDAELTVIVPAAGFAGACDAGVAVAAGGIAERTPVKAHVARLADVVAVAVFIGAALGDGDAVAGEAAVAFLEFISLPAVDVADHAGIVAIAAFAVFTPLDAELTVGVGFAGVVFRQADTAAALQSAGPLSDEGVAGAVQGNAPVVGNHAGETWITVGLDAPLGAGLQTLDDRLGLLLVIGASTQRGKRKKHQGR